MDSKRQHHLILYQPAFCEPNQSPICMYLVLSERLTHFLNILFSVGLTLNSQKSRKSPFPSIKFVKFFREFCNMKCFSTANACSCTDSLEKASYMVTKSTCFLYSIIFEPFLNLHNNIVFQRNPLLPVTVIIVSAVVLMFSLSVTSVFEFRAFPGGLEKLSGNEKQYPLWKSPELNTSKQIYQN